MSEALPVERAAAIIGAMPGAPGCVSARPVGSMAQHTGHDVFSLSSVPLVLGSHILLKERYGTRG